MIFFATSHFFENNLIVLESLPFQNKSTTSLPRKTLRSFVLEGTPLLKGNHPYRKVS